MCTGELGGGEFEGRGKGRPTKCMLHGGGGVGRKGGGFAEQGEPVHGQAAARKSLGAEAAKAVGGVRVVVELVHGVLAGVAGVRHDAHRGKPGPLSTHAVFALRHCVVVSRATGKVTGKSRQRNSARTRSHSACSGQPRGAPKRPPPPPRRRRCPIPARHSPSRSRSPRTSAKHACVDDRGAAAARAGPRRNTGT